MQNMTAQQWLDKWGNNLNGAVQNYKTGVQNVKTAPGAAAAAKADKMLAGITQAITSGKWAANVSAVSLSQWQQAAASKGAANIPAGVAQAKLTKVASITKMLADTNASAASVANMPTDTLQQRIAKAVQYMNNRAAAAAQG